MITSLSYEGRASSRRIIDFFAIHCKSTLRELGENIGCTVGLGAIIGVLLSPLGFEKQSSELRSLAFAAFFTIVGILLPIAGLVLMFWRPRIAGILAVIAAALLFLMAPADQALFFFTVAPPFAVSAGEYILILVGIGYMLFGPRVFDRNRTRNAPRTSSVRKLCSVLIIGPRSILHRPTQEAEMLA